MKNLFKTLFLLAIVIGIFSWGFVAGEYHKQQEIENRAKKIKTEAITQQQLEKIIFNEVQL